jgi:hypothetical protein
VKIRRSSRRELSSVGKGCIAISRPILASFLFLFAVLFSGSMFLVQGAVVPTRIEFAMTATAGARDGTNYDLPPDQNVSSITNGFWAFETNLAVAASVASAQSQSGATQRAEIQPLLITAQGNLNAAASIDTNRNESAAAQASCRLDLLFDLPVQHACSINVTNLGGVSPGNLLGQIVLTRNASEEVFASRLPTNSGPASQSGVLLSGGYRLLAEYVVSPLAAPPATASSGNAAFSLRMTFSPILPLLNITRSSNGVVLTWTTNDTAAFLLQSNTNLAGTNWMFIYGPYPVSGGEYSAEQSASDAGRFYRLVIP